MANPSIEYFKELNKLWGYLLKFLNIYKQYTCIGENTLYILGHCDLSWGNNINNRKSTSGYIFFLSIGNKEIFNPISWFLQ
jgi:hypothetical protein